MTHTWKAEKVRIEKRKAKKVAGRKRWILETPDHQSQVAQDTGGAYHMNWSEGTGPLTLAVFNRRSEKVRLRVCDAVRMDGLVWSVYNAERPQWWTTPQAKAVEASRVDTKRVGKYLNSILSAVRSIQNGTNNSHVDWQEVAENFELIADDARLMADEVFNGIAD
jgi:hypothetical protein